MLHHQSGEWIRKKFSRFTDRDAVTPWPLPSSKQAMLYRRLVSQMKLSPSQTKTVLAGVIIDSFELGAVTTASLHLGFPIYEKMTVKQAEKFHKFVLPMIEKHYSRIKGDTAKEDEFRDFYQNSMPVELLCYLLKAEVENER